MQKRRESGRIRDNIAVFFKENTVFLSVNQLVNAEEQAVFWDFPRIHGSRKCKKTR